MKRWSAMLESELSSWPGISNKSMFGFLLFSVGAGFLRLFRRRAVSTALRRSSQIQSNAINLAARCQERPPHGHQHHTRISGKGWFPFELGSERDLREALL
jgi:hypothetical protein